jgi:hypothetical protein
MKSRDVDHVDPAALGGAAIAAVLAIMLTKGPYDWLNVVEGVTLVLILFAYQSNRPRNLPQSMAFGAVVALVFLPIIGVALELIRGGGSLEGMLVNVLLASK